MVSHDNFIFESSCLLHILGDSVGFGTEEKEERILSYLPLSHVAGFMLDVISPIVCSANSEGWVAVFFARPYDLKEKAIKDRLNVAKPTIFLGVPLVWEKIADQIREIGRQVTGVARSVADWSKAVCLDHARNSQLGGSGEAAVGHTVAKLVLGKVKARLGLDQCKFAFTGAAPMRVDTMEYFGSLNMFINEVYGMSECTGACTFSTDQAHVWGSCGWEIPGVEVKAFLVDPHDLNKKVECMKAPDVDHGDEKYQGELCFRGRNIMMGYMACPDLGPAHLQEIRKKTAETIDDEGWLHSGDKGMITAQGMIKITGRYKELIIGEGGENIAPVPIEDAVKKHCEGIAEVIMVGDKRKYNIALITLKAVGANGEVPGTDELDKPALKVNPQVTTISAAMKDQAWIDAVTNAIKAANNDGKVCPNNAFKIQKFTILPTNFSEAAGELTPTKKLKRKMVEVKFAAVIDKMYAASGTYVPYSA
uniref:AMP-dependent synthetase/ligase domain-containing protein n=1 Tax=Zooxanthella nutricula TaxID=1333877 RepID=A0A7S2KVM6_9DINO